MRFKEIGDDAILLILEYIPIQVSRYEFTLDLFRFSGISRQFYKLVWKRLKGLRIKSRLCVRYIFRKDVPETIFERMLRLKTLSCETSTQRNEIFIASVCKGFCNVVDSFLQNKEYNIDPSDMDNESIREASKEGQLDMVKCLVKDPRVDPSDSGNEALVSAARGNYTELAKFLMRDPRVMDCEGGVEAADYASTKEMEDLIRKKFRNHEVSKSYERTLKTLKEYLESFQEELRARIDGYVQVRTLSGLQKWVKRFHQDMNLAIKKFKRENYYIKSVTNSPHLTSKFSFSSSALPTPCPYITPSQREEYDKQLSNLVDSFGCIPVPGPKPELKSGSTNNEESSISSSHYVGNLDPLYSRPSNGKGMIYDVGAYHSLRIRISGNFTDGLIYGKKGREYYNHNGALKYVGKFSKGFRDGRGVEFEMDGKTVLRRGVWKGIQLIQEDKRMDVRDTETWLELPYEEYNISIEEEEEEEEEEEREFPSPPPSPVDGEESEEIFQQQQDEDEEEEEILQEEEEIYEEKNEKITTTTTTPIEEEEEEEEENDKNNITNMNFLSDGKTIDLDQSLEESILYQNLESRMVVHGKKLQVLYGLIKENRKQRILLQSTLEKLDRNVPKLDTKLNEEKIYQQRQIILLKRMIQFKKGSESFWEDGWKSLVLSFFVGILVCYVYIFLLGISSSEEDTE